MKKFILTLIAFCLSACVSGNLDDTLTKSSQVSYDTSAFSQAITNVDGTATISTTTSIALQDSFKNLNDIGTVSIQVVSNSLDISNGSFAAIDNVLITLQMANADLARPAILLVDHNLTTDEQNNQHLNLPVALSSTQLLDYLSAGEVVLAFNLTVDGNGLSTIPTDYTHTMTLHIDVSVSKNL